MFLEIFSLKTLAFIYPFINLLSSTIAMMPDVEPIKLNGRLCFEALVDGMHPFQEYWIV